MSPIIEKSVKENTKCFLESIEDESCEDCGFNDCMCLEPDDFW
jgi:hypothetical protein